MSDIIRQLRRLKGKKQDAGDEKSSADPEKQSRIDKLKTLIAGIENRSKTGFGSVGATVTNLSGLLSEDLSEGPGQHIEDLIPGQNLENEKGSFFRVRTEYPWHHYQGDAAVSSLLDVDPTCLGWALSDARLKKIDFRKALFFDTETTGLDTGTGVYIFLAGFGYFKGRSFVVEQYFMRDFPDEPAVLLAIEQLLKKFRYIVTYNGKTYDWPLLETRFIVHRRSLPDPTPPHLDLLTLSRRMYHFRLENCRLPTVEKHIINFHRKDDLPGALLPDLYFKYVRSRDARFIHRAFAHNAHDIVSLAAIAAKIIQFMENPFSEDSHAADIFAFARLKENANDPESAKKAYREALRMGLPKNLYNIALRRLSLLLKREGDWEKALELWDVMIRTGKKDDPFPYEEKAKYLEHRKKDYPGALQVVHQARRNVGTADWKHISIQQELLVREKRLIAKINGIKWRRPGRREDGQR